MSVISRYDRAYYQDPGINIKSLLGIFAQHKALLLGTTLLCAFLGWAYTLNLTSIYQVDAAIQLPESPVTAQSPELEHMRSLALLGKVVETLDLGLVVAPHSLPILDRLPSRLAHRDLPSWLGLQGMVREGEHVEVSTLEVPDSLTDQRLTLTSEGDGQFTLRDATGSLLLSGHSGQTLQGNGLSLEVAVLSAHAGAQFFLMRQRTETAARQLQHRLDVAEAGRGSGVFYLSLEAADASQAARVLNEVSRQYSLENSNARLIAAAATNAGEPVGPQTDLIIWGATLFGADLALVLTYLRQTRYRRLDSPYPLEHLGLAVLASMPWSNRQERLRVHRKTYGRRSKTCLLSILEPMEPAVESLRSLRTSLSLAIFQTKNPLVMITSPTADCGKSFVAANLAVVLAQTGKRVLLIDADLHNGQLHRGFNQPGAGVTDVLSERKALHEVIQATPVENLDLLVRGLAALNPTELLTPERLGKLLGSLCPRYEAIIISTPATLDSRVPEMVGQLAGTTLMVTRVGLTSIQQVATARKRLASHQVSIAGVVLNGLVRQGGGAFDGAALGYAYSPDKPWEAGTK